MIKSINREFDEEMVRVHFEELDEREENLCVFAACALEASPCGGQACLVACIGASVCLLGLHTL